MKIWQVDSFTTSPFSGNPAGVMVLSTDISDDMRQKIAMEMSLSETAFILLENDRLSIRWFTPNAEVNLCGHATLAAAHILWSQRFVTAHQIEFSSKSGPLRVSKEATDRYTLDFPCQAATIKPEYSKLVQDILAHDEFRYVGSNGEDCVVVVDSDAFVREYKPNLSLISMLPERGFLLSAQDSSGMYDYIYRGFFPKLGIAEDPVTGSANTLLAPYWGTALGKTAMTAYQASDRGGTLSLELRDGRVLITGSAVTVLEGELKLDFGSACSFQAKS